MRTATLLILSAGLAVVSSTVIAQTNSGYTPESRDNSLQEHWQRPASAATQPFLSTLGIGVKVGTLGVGGEVAAPVSDHLNVRAGASFFNYNDSFSQDGFNYRASLRFRSAQATLDWFPFRNGFHVSPGALLYSGNRLSATPTVAAGQTFTLNDTDYVSSATDPIRGAARLEFAKAAPMVTVGWGNLVSRGEHHLSFPVEVGLAYVGDPSIRLSFTGSACDQGGVNCRSINSDSMFQANVLGQQRKISDDVSPLRFFPIVSTGIGYRF